MFPQQFEIWLTDLDTTRGSEQKGIRPCAILQTDEINKYGKTTLIAPLSSQKTEKIYVSEVFISPSKINRLKIPSKIKLDQIRVIDKVRLIKKLGKIEKKYVDNIFSSIKIIFDLAQDFQ